jgi:hypothetical protein
MTLAHAALGDSDGFNDRLIPDAILIRRLRVAGLSIRRASLNCHHQRSSSKRCTAASSRIAPLAPPIAAPAAPPITVVTD